MRHFPEQPFADLELAEEHPNAAVAARRKFGIYTAGRMPSRPRARTPPGSPTRRTGDGFRRTQIGSRPGPIRKFGYKDFIDVQGRDSTPKPGRTCSRRPARASPDPWPGTDGFHGTEAVGVNARRWVPSGTSWASWPRHQKRDMKFVRGLHHAEEWVFPTSDASPIAATCATPTLSPST
jgi:hypothetical protein